MPQYVVWVYSKRSDQSLIDTIHAEMFRSGVGVSVLDFNVLR